MPNTVRAQINLSALRHNFSLVRELCPASRIMAMIKANAYGHGLLPVAQALGEADGLAVARLQEALELRRAGIKQRVQLLGTLLDDEDLRICSAQGIDVTAHDMATVERIAGLCAEAPLRVWLKLDSGMHRLGLDPEQFLGAEQRLRGLDGILELGHMTHFSSADNPASTATAQQLAQFTRAHAASMAPVSIANSAALISLPGGRADWVRPGIMLYGDNPLAATHPLPLRPVMSLRARVLALRHLEKGEPVGYSCTWRGDRNSRIATLGIGYGDGYPRHAPSGTPVWINGKTAALAGTVSMDTISIDVTDCPGVEVGMEAELWGEQLAAAEVASHANTISYELFTGIADRVPREYVDR